jgi:phage terminase large subunit-like protein
VGSAVADETLVRIPGKYERLAWERHERDLVACLEPGGHPKGYWFDDEAGERVVQFIEDYCCHFEGEWAGRPLKLEEWQRTILRIVFGWKRTDGARRFRTAYIEIPRKNGKSTWTGGVGLFLTIADGEPGAQVYATATKKDQAKIVWGAAAAMVRHSTRLRKFATAFKANIHCSRLGSKFEPLAADSETQDGFNAHAQLADEMHAHKDRHVYDVVATSMGSRRQPLNWIITTAGIYAPESIGWEMHERAIQVLEGSLEDDTFFAFITAAGEEDDWGKPETWLTANPNLGVSVKWEYMAEQCARAQTTPSFLNTFLRYHLNRWTQQRDRWIPIEAWNACERVVDEQELLGLQCTAGLDLSATIDITALTLCFPREDGFFDFVYRFWCPEETIMRRSKEDRVPYDAWARDGWLIPTPGNVVDYNFPIAELQEMAKRYRLVEAAYDPWNATQTATDLQESGLAMVEFRQGFRSMSEPSKQMEKLVVSAKFGHLTPKGAHPVMRWMVANVAIKRDPAENIKPDKSSAIGRIDGVVSSIMSLGRAIVIAVPQLPMITILNDEAPREENEPGEYDEDFYQ